MKACFNDMNLYFVLWSYCSYITERLCYFYCSYIYIIYSCYL